MKRIAVLLAAALISSALPAVADAQGRDRRGDYLDQGQGRGQDRRGDRQDSDRQDRGGQQQEREIPLSQLIRMVERTTGGEYVNANPRMQGGRKYYWIRLRFPGGRFQDYMVDAATGQF
jgi:uncharacterized membrane protein YkoI